MSQQKPIKVRWLIAHFPVQLFLRAAHLFRRELNKLAPGQFDLEILVGKGDYLKKYGHELDAETREQLRKFLPVNIKGLEEVKDSVNDLNSTRGVKYSDEEFAEKLKDGSKDYWDHNVYWKKIFDLLKNQNFEISQTQVNLVGSHLDRNFHAIDLPYLFEGHDHVAEVLDGEIGRELSRRVQEKTGVQALGYTYSGGYRIIGSTDGITSLNDLNSKKFIGFTAPSSKFFADADVNVLARHNTTADDLGDIAEEGGALETTYIRFHGKNVLKTNHSMFMTSILTSDKFMNSLTDEQREAFVEAAHRVSRAERLWSVEDAEQYEVNAVERGITITDISADDEARLRASAANLYNEETLTSLGIDPDLVNEIRAKGEKYKK